MIMSTDYKVKDISLADFGRKEKTDKDADLKKAAGL
jgi:hypothetical protein